MPQIHTKNIGTFESVGDSIVPGAGIEVNLHSNWYLKWFCWQFVAIIGIQLRAESMLDKHITWFVCAHILIIETNLVMFGDQCHPQRETLDLGDNLVIIFSQIYECLL